MISNRPYLIRAFHEWITDNDWTPYILVNALVPGCQLPEAHVTNGTIVFNIAHDVVEHLALGNKVIEFTARFSGVPTPIHLPVSAVTAIYAKENGEGMAFPKDMDMEMDEDGEAGKTPGSQRTKGKPNLKVVK